MTTYSKAQLIDIFGAIPEERWSAEIYRGKDAGCAIVNAVRLERTLYPHLSSTLIEALKGCHSRGVIGVNEGECPRYQQPTPKQRIMAALHDLP